MPEAGDRANTDTAPGRGTNRLTSCICGPFRLRRALAGSLLQAYKPGYTERKFGAAWPSTKDRDHGVDVLVVSSDVRSLLYNRESGDGRGSAEV